MGALIASDAQPIQSLGVFISGKWSFLCSCKWVNRSVYMLSLPGGRWVLGIIKVLCEIVDRGV